MTHLSEQTIRFIDAWAIRTATELPYSQRLRMRLAIAMRNFPEPTEAQTKLAEQFVVCLYLSVQRKYALAEPSLYALVQAGATADAHAASDFIALDEVGSVAQQAIDIARMH
jgi:hypothetical protein